jgi:hypothetical protein
MSLPRQARLNKILDGDNQARVQELAKLLGEVEKVL